MVIAHQVMPWIWIMCVSACFCLLISKNDQTQISLPIPQTWCLVVQETGGISGRGPLKVPDWASCRTASRDPILPHFGSVVGFVTALNISTERLYEVSERTLWLSHASFLCVIKHFFSGYSGIWIKWRQSDCVLCPGLSWHFFPHLPPHLCQYEQMT